MNFSQVSGDDRFKKKKNLASRSLVYFILSFDVVHFKVFIEFITIVLLLMTFFFEQRFFGFQTCGILAPRPRIKLAPPELGGAVLITGAPGKSH